jgi:hypothetical protein
MGRDLVLAWTCFFILQLCFPRAHPHNPVLSCDWQLIDSSRQIGRILPLLSRAITRATMPDIPHAEVDYNVVQNNGPGAAQVVPHVSVPPQSCSLLLN